MKYLLLLLLCALLVYLVLKPEKVHSEPPLEVVEVISVEPLILSPRGYAFQEVSKVWGFHEWQAFEAIIEKESGWDSNAQSKTSTAYGLGQFLNSTWKLVGCSKTSDPHIQIDCAIKYISLRYQLPSKALRFHLANNYY